ncbi:pyruvate dehydrogenase E1 component alpha subunit [Sporobacter termitidis DSM 10068]|uniref:Pyruvate dehydrogenase E1 component alpha subunit n=1 Tax=Sporobacter termitidis DSM 10068 TaxID=1123282 RepID=A0A1M5YRB6_9FIRM|nr:thiamine pyrophosphate-dependent dehydrogenase E1 component subunit alpha [Sporobacter termitidis]SHI14404.1 pyruvate dehydrogenase E1 component alpha subunit [Sporobacter termitidis DSM 10068]
MKSLKDENREEMLELLRMMVRIRAFEEKAARLFLDGKLIGFLHLYSGEEAVATGVCACLREDDYITSTHRGHGHCLAKGADINRMMAELYGKATGYSKDKGGSMHIADISKGIIGANGIVGAGIPIAVGAGFAQKYRETDGVAVTFFGDGASNRGTFHEALNMSAALNLPVIFICENNQFGMSTPFAYHSKNKTISQRAAAYDIPGVTVDGNDPIAVRDAAAIAVARARTGEGPTLIECLTWRHYGHFVGDSAPYKKPEDQTIWREKDPIPNFEKRLMKEGVANAAEIDKIQAETEEEIQAAVEFAEESPYPEIDVMFEDLDFSPADRKE